MKDKNFWELYCWVGNAIHREKVLMALINPEVSRRIRKAVNEEIEKTSDCKPLSPSNLSDILQDFLKRGIVHCLYEGKKGKKRVYELTELGKEVWDQLMKTHASKILSEFEKAGWVVKIRKPKADYGVTEKGERIMA